MSNSDRLVCYLLGKWPHDSCGLGHTYPWSLLSSNQASSTGEICKFSFSAWDCQPPDHPILSLCSLQCVFPEGGITCSIAFMIYQSKSCFVDLLVLLEKSFFFVVVVLLLLLVKLRTFLYDMDYLGKYHILIVCLLIIYKSRSGSVSKNSH